MNIVLVESPTKARTLSKFLGKDYRIEATFGHLRDLPKGELGVDVEQGFIPKYVIPRDKLKRVNELKKLIQPNDTVILATDPDREGEAIAWHIAHILRSSEGSKSRKSRTGKTKTPLSTSTEGGPTSSTFSTFRRITFHEITEEAIQDSLIHPGEINIQLVDAQQARRVLDRLVGYKLSPLLWKKLSRSWLSAGRVQSVALRLIVEREREIEKFKKEEFWVIEGEFIQNQSFDKLRTKIKNQKDNSKIKNAQSIKAKLVSKDNIKYEISETIKLFDGSYTYTKSSVVSHQSSDSIIQDLTSSAAQPFTVSAVDKKEIKRSPPPPYTTASLQIDAGRKLGFSGKRIMQIAQRLYEDGLITYHRTDSVNLATKFLGQAKGYIEKTFGEKYAHYRTYATKSKLAQEAHEAIRPTHVGMTNDQFPMINELTEQHKKLYELIWKRAVASQMSEAIFDSTTIIIDSKNGYEFQTQGSVIKFDGFLKVTGYTEDEAILPEVSVPDSLSLNEVVPTQKFTSPPPRYSEASLVKALEEDGIGRPSTYAPIISTIVERQYVAKEMKEDGRRGRNFVPTELGFLVNDFLVKYFSNIVDLPFTATMEDHFDKIAQGEEEWVPVISEFYTPFAKKLEEVTESAEKVEIPFEKTGKTCPECKEGEVLIKQGRYGKFYACSKFPACKYTGSFVEKIDVKCSDCKEGDVIIRKTKRGRIFYGCSRYPKCTFASWTKPIAK